MLNNVRTSMLRSLALAPFAVAVSVLPALAQEPSATTTICRYNPESGVPNVLGMRTYVSLTESEGNTVVTLDRFPSFVTSPETPEQQADVSEVRSLTLYDTSIAAARQLLIAQPLYYAELLEIDEADVGEGFAPIDATLGCDQVAAEPDPAEEMSEEATEEATESPTENPMAESEQPTGIDLSALPNGNYRFTSAAFPNSVVSDQQLVETGGALFLFRKFGDNITGNFSYIDAEGGFCISGEVIRTAVVGTAYKTGDTIREEGFLTLGAESEDADYPESVLSLEGFSRINAGTRLPVESCPQ